MFLLLACCRDSSARTANRKGFLIGYGPGGAFTSFKALDTHWDYFCEAADYKIGIGHSDQWLFFLSWKSLRFDAKDFRWPEYESKTEIAKINSTLLSLSYFFSPKVPSFFISGGIGITSWNQAGGPFYRGSNFWQGPGVFAGAGYEIIRHVTIEVSGLYANGGNSSSGNNPITVMLTLNVIIY